ncbi:Fructokinase [Sulfitobacter noctilucicola]|uniref:Fructokinase n=1 Tax=Sulfitobacter noctilucicola TaxID=1342301 RepID=A0A7W6MB41_9RHOB|nr:nucleoside/nucleotide kinase family protein [Sulfitobacter noctilucicola]KIN64173.1 Fructokinase [Sulfitobacter noctilucicola]MBB4175527.1 fructokinase [Sulfitobacter noctilucicola]
MKSDPRSNVDHLLPLVMNAPRQGTRRVVAIAGPPASGKSTLAEALVAALNGAGCATQLVPMDGFHLDNRILSERGLLNRKGAPETFDAEGLLRLVGLLGSDLDLYYPVFDRALDLSIAGAGYISPQTDTIVIEGNYLMMQAPIWADMETHWDLSISITCPPDVLEERLIQRWLDHGLAEDAARARAEENDLPNARLIAASMGPADVTL